MILSRAACPRAHICAPCRAPSPAPGPRRAGGSRQPSPGTSLAGPGCGGHLPVLARTLETTRLRLVPTLGVSPPCPTRLCPRAHRRVVSAPVARDIPFPACSQRGRGRPIGCGRKYSENGLGAGPTLQTAPGSCSRATARVVLLSRQSELAGSSGRERGAPGRRQDSPYPCHAARWLARLSWAKGTGNFSPFLPPAFSFPPTSLSFINLVAIYAA